MEIARQAGFSEDEVDKLNRAYDDQAKAVAKVRSEQSKQVVTTKQLTAEAKRLEAAIENATDEGEAKKFRAELDRVEAQIRDTTREARKLDTELDKVGSGRKLSGLKSSFSDVLSIASGGLLAGGIAGAIEGIVSGFSQLASESLELYDIQATADEQLRQSIASTQGVIGLTFEQYKQQAQDLQGVTLFGDEVIQGAQTLLNSFTNIRGEIAQNTIPVILDVATRLDTDLNSAVLQVGKALNDPIAGLSALSRSGIQFSDAQKETIKQLVATGQAAEAQTIILKELETQFGGAAEAAARAGTGGIVQLQNQISDLKEEIGAELLPAQELLTRAQLAFTRVLVDVIGFVREVGERFQPVIDRLRGAGEGSQNLARFFGFLQSAIEILIDQGVNNAIFAWNLLIDAFEIAGAGIGLVVEGVDRARASFSGIAAFLQSGFNDLVANLAQQFFGLQQIIEGVFELDGDKITSGLNNVVNTSYSEIGSNAGEAFSEAFDSRLAEIQAPLDTPEADAQIKEVGTKAGQTITSGIQTELNINRPKVKVDTTPAENTVAFFQAQIKELRDELNLRIEVDDTDARNEVRAQIAEIEEIIENANSVFGFTLEPLGDNPFTPPEIEPVEIPVDPPQVQAEDIFPENEADQLRVRLENAVAGLDALDAALSGLSFDTSGISDFSDLLRTNIEETGQLFGNDGFGIEEGLGVANAAITTTSSILDQFAENRIKRQELQREELVRIEEETGRDQSAAIAEVDAEIERIQRNQFIRQQATAAAQAAINTALAITQVIAQAPLAAPILVPVIAGLGAVQLGLILSTPAPFKEGVFSLGTDRASYPAGRPKTHSLAERSKRSVFAVKGPGTGTSDDIDAKISRGESVLTERDTNTFEEVVRGIVEHKPHHTFQIGSSTVYGWDMPKEDREKLQVAIDNQTATIVPQVTVNEVKPPADAVLYSRTFHTVNNSTEVKVPGIDYDKLAERVADKMVDAQRRDSYKENNVQQNILQEMKRQNELLMQLVYERK